jgi:branched-subunit amino acid aminotransferase/4-amino-4-deoxychorismate lyase
MIAGHSVGAHDHVSGGAPAVPLRETCRLVSGRVPLWPYHRQRLASGGCGDAVLRAADAALEREAEGWTGPYSSRLRLTLVVTPDGRVDARVQRRLSSLDVPGGPMAVAVDADGAPPLPTGAAKPADRTWWDEAQRRARALGGDQAIITAPDGRVIDGGTASVWAVFGGSLVTPPAPDAVAGVARAFLLDACARAGVPARVADLDLASLDAADELFLTNAFAGAVAVRGRGGRVFAAVAEEFGELWGA